MAAFTCSRTLDVRRRPRASWPPQDQAINLVEHEDRLDAPSHACRRTVCVCRARERAKQRSVTALRDGMRARPRSSRTCAQTPSTTSTSTMAPSQSAAPNDLAAKVRGPASRRGSRRAARRGVEEQRNGRRLHGAALLLVRSAIQIAHLRASAGGGRRGRGGARCPVGSRARPPTPTRTAAAALRRSAAAHLARCPLRNPVAGHQVSASVVLPWSTCARF